MVRVFSAAALLLCIFWVPVGYAQDFQVAGTHYYSFEVPADWQAVSSDTVDESGADAMARNVRCMAVKEASVKAVLATELVIAMPGITSQNIFADKVGEKGFFEKEMEIIDKQDITLDGSPAVRFVKRAKESRDENFTKQLGVVFPDKESPSLFYILMIRGDEANMQGMDEVFDHVLESFSYSPAKQRGAVIEE